MDKQKGQQKYKYTHSKMLKHRRKNNVNRETQVLKAIINQTRSIGNEFLVINIKAEPGQQAMRGAGLYSALLACRTKSTIINNQRTPTTTLSPSPGMEMKIEQTTTTTTSRWRWKKESQQAYIFGFIYSYADQRDATWWQRRPLLLTGENVNKKYGFNFTPVWNDAGGGIRPWICGDRE